MDNKVKITLITTGVLLILIISYGLYSTFNPEIAQKSNVQKTSKPQQAQTNRRVKANIGEKSNLDIRTNDYYFPKKKVKREKIDPSGYMVKEVEEDDFFDLDKKEVFDIIDDYDDDYVQAPDADESMMDNPDQVEF